MKQTVIVITHFLLLDQLKGFSSSSSSNSMTSLSSLSLSIWEQPSLNDFSVLLEESLRSLLIGPLIFDSWRGLLRKAGGAWWFESLR